MFFFECTGDHRDLHRLTHSFPARRSSDLSFQEAVTDTLAIKCQRALDATGYSQLIVAGGVGANLRLREKLGECARRNNFELFFPRQAFCTDNGAMIARSEEHTSELQSLMRNSYAVFCLKKNK